MSADGHPPPPLSEAALATLTSLGLSMDEGRRREYYAKGWWTRATLVAGFLRACEAHADKTAIIAYRSTEDAAHRLTYREVAGHVDRVAAGLIHLGIGVGDVVSAQLPNWWEFAVTALAASRIGAAFNPIVPILRRREVTFMTKLLESKVCVVPRHYRGFDHATMLADVATAVPSLQHRIVVGGEAGPGELSFEEDVLGHPWERSYAQELAARTAEPDAVSDIQFTSGTTGEPKGVGHTHNTLHACARAVYETLQLDVDDSVFMPAPLSHSIGFVYGCMTPLSRGMTAIYQDVWDPVRGLDIIAAESPRWTFGSTAFIVDLVRAHRNYPVDTTSLRYFVTGGAPIPPVVVTDARSELGTRVIAVWGMTENGAVTCTRLDEPPDAAAESDGLPCPWMELKVVDRTTGQSLPPDIEGELHARGASQMLGYVRRPSLTKALVDPDGWFDTGDLARLSTSGHLRITGRSKDIIIRGGENLPVAEIEKALYAHRAVAEVAVVGYPDDRLGERACAVVVPAEGATPTLDDLTDHLEEVGLPRAYWPERLELMAALPRTPSGKVQKFVLREALAAESRAGT
jgi:cyclohexanecarboxylate-CoA ligase